MFKLKRRIRDSANGPRTHIAPLARIVGTIAGRGTYICYGSIDGDCELHGILTLAESGRWKGRMKATDIIISGVVEGDVVAQQRIEIARTARVRGSLSGKSIAVAEGASIEGTIKVTSGAAPVTFQEKRQT